MHKKIQEAISNHLAAITRINNCEADLELAEKLMPDAHIYTDGDVNISWAAKSMDEIKAALRKFAKHKIMLNHVYESQTRPIWYLNGLYAKVILIPHWSDKEEEGVTCKLIQVGVETPEPRPIYKLVCDNMVRNNDEVL